MSDHAASRTSDRAASPPLVGGAVRRPRRPRLWLAALAAAVLAAGAAGAWWRLSGPSPVRYVSAVVARGAVTRTVTATGTVNPTLTVIVGSYVSGVIQSLSCDYNTKVVAGQVCAKVDPRPYQATLNQHTGQLLRDQAILAKDRANLARYRKLAEQNSIARQQAEDQAYLVAQDEGAVKLDLGLVESARLNLEYTNIISPVDGTVVSRNVTQGQTVAASFQTPTLFLIAKDLKQMQVDTNISESDVGGIREGATATFTVDAYPNRVFRGTVAQLRLSPQTVQNVVTYNVVVRADNDDLALLPGMTASTLIIIAERKDVLRLPDPALRFAPGGLAGAGRATPASGEGRVWVLRDGQPVAVAVVPGLDDGNFTEILKGDLQPGDRVVTAEARDPARPASGLPLPRF